jgi:hypothetical protein
MGGDRDIRDGFEEHSYDGTDRRAGPSGRDTVAAPLQAGSGAPRPVRHGVVNPRVYAPSPEVAATTYR